MQLVEYQVNNFFILEQIMNGKDLKALRLKAGLSQQELADATGIKRGTLGRIEASGEEIKKVDVLRTLEDYFKNEQNEQFLAQEPEKPSYNKVNSDAKFVGAYDYPTERSGLIRELGDGRYSFEVPLVYTHARAGVYGGWPDLEFIEDLPRHMYTGDSYPHGEYMAFEVTGDSMENYTSKEAAKESIPDGAIVTGRRLRQDHWKTRLHLHKYQDWIIVTNDDVYVKRIIAHDVEKGTITCHSLNPEYKDFELNLRDVRMLLNVMPRKLV